MLPHLLGGDVVGVHPLGGALDGKLCQVVILAPGEVIELVQHIHQLGEGGGDIHALLVLDALQPLGQDLLDDGGVFLHVGVALPEHQEQGDEGGLAVGGHEGVDLILDGLHAAFQLVPGAGPGQLLHGGVVQLGGGLPGAAEVLLIGEPQILAQVAHLHRLAAVLVGGHAGDDLGDYGAGHLEALGGLNELAVDHGAVVQHIADVHQAAVEDVLNKVVRVVEVEHALVVGLGDVLGQEDAPGQVPAHLPGNVVPLGGGDGGVLVGVLLRQLLVVVADQGEDGLVGGVGLAHQGPGVAVDDVGLGQLVLAGGHQLGLHHILYVLHQQALAALGGRHRVGDVVDGGLVQAVGLVHRLVGLLDGGYDLRAVELNDGIVSLDHFHGSSPFLSVSNWLYPVPSTRRAGLVPGPAGILSHSTELPHHTISCGLCQAIRGNFRKYCV